MTSDQSEASSGGVALAFLSGVFLGAAMAFLITPQTGQESREGLLRAARRAGDDFRDLTEKATDTWEGVVVKGREFIGEAGSIVQDAMDAGRDAMRREREYPPPSKESFPQT